MMFDNSSPPAQTDRNTTGDHIALVVLIGGALAVAFGMHFASLTVAAIGAGHLLVAGLAIAIRSLRARRAADSSVR